MNKTELRKDYLQRRSELRPMDVAAASQKIAERFFRTVDFAVVRHLHTFIRIPKFNEVDTSVIYMRVWRDHPAIATSAPAIDHATGEMTSVQFDGSSEFVEDRWGIREPNGCEIVDPSSIDVVLVPLLCFDTSGHRVGYGKGFYDRFLMKLRPDCQKIGVTYWPPAHGPIDTHDGDRTLDLCITPDETFRFDETIQMPDQ